MAGPTKCKTWWTEIQASFERHHDALITGHPDAQEEIRLVRTVLIKICQLVRNSPSVNGDGPLWKQLADKAEAKRERLCRHLDGKAVYRCAGLYAAIHREMNET
jgi:hypothetical protein